MLRLARLRPLARTFTGWTHFPRVYASTEPLPTSGKELDTAFEDILNQIQAKETTTQPRSTIGQSPGNSLDGGSSTSLSAEESPLDAFNFTHYTDKTLGDAKYTTRSYDRFLEQFPALNHEVDTQKLHAKLKYEQIYLKDHAHEAKTVFKFNKVVKKNYRTIARSWPMVYLNSFKYGNEHFVDEMYDNIEGKYTWNNQLAYPDGSINLFCGTSSKASPVNVKGDPLALTYDDSLHNSDTIKPVSLRVTKTEALARFPKHFEPEQLRDTQFQIKRMIGPRPAVPELETEAEEDERKILEKELAEEYEAERAAKRYELDRDARDKYIPNNIDETIPERKKRWRWETAEDNRRPWRTFANRGVHRSWDDRVLYDPVTMVRLVSFSARGCMIERYYYRDELTRENTFIGAAGSDIELDPDFDPKTGVLGYPEKNDWRLDASPTPSVDSEEAYCSRDPNAYENVRQKAVAELFPAREKESEESKVEYKQKELRKDLLDAGVLPDSIREDMVNTFQELVEEGALRQEDKWVYYNDYVRLTGKSMARARAEEYRKNKAYNSNVELPGMYQVDPTYYFKYIKINVKEGWIRFYIGEHNRAEKLLDTLIDSEFTLETDKTYSTMKYPFVWRYSEYKLSPEDIEAMKQVKWPPSLVPPPTSSTQVGDGSPQSQLAEYFEKTYLQFGHDVRFNPQDCFDPAFDKLEDPNLKYLRSVGSSASDVQFVPDPGQLDLSANKNLLTEEDRAKEDQRLRGVIRRTAADAMERETESMVSAYANQLVIDEYFAKKTAEEVDEIVDGHSQLWLDNSYTTIDPDLVPHCNVTAPITRFRAKGDTVFAYDSTNQKIIQEYQGYRLKATQNKIRIVRLPTAQNAKVIFYNDKGGVDRTEYHPAANIDFTLSHDRSRDRVGRSAWAFTSDAQAEIAAAYGLPSKRAQEIQKAEQSQADALTEALSNLETADDPDDPLAEERDGVDDNVMLKDIVAQNTKK